MRKDRDLDGEQLEKISSAFNNLLVKRLCRRVNWSL